MDVNKFDLLWDVTYLKDRFTTYFVLFFIYVSVAPMYAAQPIARHRHQQNELKLLLLEGISISMAILRLRGESGTEIK